MFICSWNQSQVTFETTHLLWSAEGFCPITLGHFWSWFMIEAIVDNFAKLCHCHDNRITQILIKKPLIILDPGSTMVLPFIPYINTKKRIEICSTAIHPIIQVHTSTGCSYFILFSWNLNSSPTWNKATIHGVRKPWHHVMLRSRLGLGSIHTSLQTYSENDGMMCHIYDMMLGIIMVSWGL